MTKKQREKIAAAAIERTRTEADEAPREYWNARRAGARPFQLELIKRDIQKTQAVAAAVYMLCDALDLVPDSLLIPF